MIILWLVDVWYTKETGKPASERIREQRERAEAPLTKGQYRFRFFLYCTVLTIFLAVALFSQEFRGWRRSRPIAYAVAFSWALIDLIRKGEIGKGETLVFLHTGGAVGLFGYTGVFEQAMTN